MKKMYLTYFVFVRTFFLITSYQISKNFAILINHKLIFQGKKFPQLDPSQFFKSNQLLPNTAIFL